MMEKKSFYQVVLNAAPIVADEEEQHEVIKKFKHEVKKALSSASSS